MDLKKKKILYILFQILFLIIINGATIAFFVMNLVSFKSVLKDGSVLEISYWDAISSKAVAEMAKNVFTWLPDYHFYNKMLVYLFMVIGALITLKASAFFIKFNQDLKPNEYKIEAEKRKYKELLKESEFRKLSKREMKKFEKLARKYGGE